MKKQSWWKENQLYPLVSLLVLLTVLNTSLVWVRAAEVNEQQELWEEQQRPALLSVTGLEAPDCTTCPSAREALDGLKKLNVNVTSEEILATDSKEAQELIEQYDIKKLPALVITGETNKTAQLDNYLKTRGDAKEGAVIYTALPPPYYDTSTGQVEGEVRITHITDDNCEQCVSLEPLAQALKEAGVAVTEEKRLSHDSTEGRSIVTSFGLSAVPALLVSEDINAYPIAEELAKMNPVSRNGYFILQPLQPPYRSVEENRVVGLTEMLYLDDDSCQECYDVNVNGQIVRRFGVALAKEETVDVSSAEGKALIEKYGIQKVPAILLSPEAQAYEGFMQVWKSVGSIEEDGWLVMRSPDPLGAYKDLSTGEVVTPE